MPAEELLRPSLDHQARTPIFSTNALIATAFLGGGLSVVLIALENARRLGRLRRDLAPLLLALLVTAGGLVGFAAYSASATDLKLLNRGLGVVFAGGCYLLHKRAYRSLTMLGIEPASPWLHALLAIALGSGFSALVYWLANTGRLQGLT